MKTQISTQTDVAKLGRILGIWAHPDDEAWCAAGLMAMARANNQDVCCVTATRGEEGVQDETRWPKADLPKIREQELADCLQILDVQSHHFLNYHDGQCPQDDAEAIQQIKQFIEQEQPDTIITFGPTGSTGHDDHKAVSSWTSVALQQTKPAKPIQLFHSVHSKEWYETSGQQLDQQFNMFFNIENPPLISEDQADICLKLSDEWCQKKLAALKAQPSQTAKLFAEANPEHLKDFACIELFAQAKTYQP